MVTTARHGPALRRHHRFAAGDRVHVASRPVLGHCRTPWFLRGKNGIVVHVHGTYRNPEQLAYHRPGLPMQTLYKVRFRQKDVWKHYPGPHGDNIEVDVYEHWLEPADHA
jgi:hypothetical protein